MAETNKIIADRLATILKERIIRWHYPPEHRLIEEELCQEFEASRSPVREALRELAAQGFVTKVPYKGYSVAQPRFEEIKQLYEVRLALELFVVEKLAAQGMSDAVYEHLRTLWVNVLTGESIESIATLDRQFHEGLAQASGNAILLKSLSDTNDRIQISRMTDFTTDERVNETSKQHLEILERIKRGDAAGARQAMAENIVDGLKNIETVIGFANLFSAVQPPD